MEEFPPYEDVVTESDIQLPMPDEPPVPPPRAPVDTTYSYSRGNAPPGMYQSGYRPFADVVHQEEVVGGQPAQPPQPPAAPQRWTLPHYPAPPKAPTPPAPWQLAVGNIAPYDEFKPKILKEVDDFHGDSNDIAQFFQKCELHFDLHNRHYRYPPPPIK